MEDATTRKHVRRELALAAVLIALIIGIAGGDLVGSSEQSPPQATASKPAKGSVAWRVDPGLVDIDTNLGYEGAAASGTGMVVSPSGEVITNNHVIEGATSIRATDVGNGKTYGVRVLGYDHSHDVAVLALDDASGLATVSLGESSRVRVGEHVLAIGNAGGVGGTPTSAGGSVLALNQSISAADELDGIPEELGGLIEIEGQVEPGESGGPLVNDAAGVIGMDTAGSSNFQFESSAGQGFAIPSAEFTSIARQIVAGEASTSTHIGASAFLGVFVASAQSASSGAPAGALVENVLRGGPAARAGVMSGDVITALDGHNVASPSELTTQMDLQHPGEVVQLAWEDGNGRMHTAPVRLGSGPPD